MPPSSSFFSAAHRHRKYAGSHQHSETAGESEATPSRKPIRNSQNVRNAIQSFLSFPRQKLGTESCLSMTWHCAGRTGESMGDIVPCFPIGFDVSGFALAWPAEASYRGSGFLTKRLVHGVLLNWYHLGREGGLRLSVLTSYWWHYEHHYSFPCLWTHGKPWTSTSFCLKLNPTFPFQFINKWLDFSEFQCPTLWHADNISSLLELLWGKSLAQTLSFLILLLK